MKLEINILTMFQIEYKL